jgi:hypothetical protein
MIRFVLFRLYCMCLRRCCSWERQCAKLQVKRDAAMRKRDIWDTRTEAIYKALGEYLKTKGGNSDAD